MDNNLEKKILSAEIVTMYDIVVNCKTPVEVVKIDGEEFIVGSEKYFKNLNRKIYLDYLMGTAKFID